MVSLAVVLAAALVTGAVWLFAVRDGGGTSSPTDHATTSVTPGPSSTLGGEPTPTSTTATTTTVRVYFHRGSADADQVEAVTRTVPRTAMPATAALGQLLAGPTEAERAAGYTSFFSARTAGTLHRLTVENGVAYADFADLRQIIPNASSSYGSAALLAELNATLRQFSTVRSTIYSFDNDAVAFYSWLQLVTPRVEGTNAVAGVYAARQFLADVAGMTDPAGTAFRVVGADNAEVDVYPRSENGAPVKAAVTTVSLRRGTASWSVTGAATATIVVDEPARAATVVSPLRVRGRALAFEGTVAVQVLGGPEAAVKRLGEGFVTGGGDVSRPFEGSVSFSPRPSERGWVVFAERSARDGSVWRLTAVPVLFGPSSQ
ncbi:hypothetical protein BCD49_11450 [Pseudofrankia sp. EUN1h]|nr:hypothetical protein BCD49_11450 [Pseudofrankia sp. EUN1h]